jgi:hypothetical protein
MLRSTKSLTEVSINEEGQQTLKPHDVNMFVVAERTHGDTQNFTFKE